MTTRILAHDYETTSVKPHHCGVVQTAIMVVDIHDNGTYEVVAEEAALHNPGRPIPDASAKIHGITDAMVADCEDFEISLSATYEQAHSEFKPTHVLGYNSNRFDNVIARRCGMQSGLIEVDLMIAAQRLMTRGYLSRARLVDAYEGLTGKAPENAHDALADLIMTLDIIFPAMQLLGIERFEDFVQWLQVPEANTDMKMPFGKHKGTRMGDMRKSYLRWLIEDATDINADLKASAQMALDMKNAKVPA